MKVRLLGAVLLAAGAAAGGRAFELRPRFAPRIGQALREAALEKRFGPDVTVGSIGVEPRGIVTLEDVRVPRQGALDAGADLDTALAEGLHLERVVLRLDALDLLAGRIVTRRIDITGGRFPLREDDGSVSPDFEVVPPDPDDAPTPVPVVQVRGARVEVRRGGPGSHLAEGAVFEAALEHLDVTPRESDRHLIVTGRLNPKLTDAPDAAIYLEGDVDPDTGGFTATARWDPLRITPALLALLEPETAKPLRQESIQEGSLVLTLQRGDGLEDPVRVRAAWTGAVDVSAEDLPGTVYFDARSRQQLADLFGRGVLKIDVEGGRVGIERLFSELGGGEVSATGWIEHETGALELDFHIRRLALDDPAVRQALGDEGRALYDQFAPRGYVDAAGRVTRAPGGEVDWYIDVLLEATSFQFVGEEEPGGIRDGFPYPIHDATGRVRITPRGVFFGEIIGFNRGTEVRILGHGDRTWTDGPQGTETGRVLFGSDGPDVRLTIVVENMSMDEQVGQAIAGSTFADLMEDFELTGVLDRVELDILALPGIDTSAKTELRLTLEGEQFRYRPFPLPLEDVRGTVVMRRPILDDGTRGRTYAFDVEGWADGARVSARAHIDDVARTGRLDIEAHDVALEGRVGEVVVASELTGDELGPVWRWLAPQGKADLVADLPLSDDPGPARFVATLKGARLALDAAESPEPIVLEGVQGRLDVDAGRVTFEGLQGTLGSRPVTISGTMEGGPRGTWSIRARAPEVIVDDRLLRGVRHLMDGESLLPGDLQPAPGTRLALDLDLDRHGGGPLEASVEVRDVAGQVVLPDGTRADVRAKRVSVRPEGIESEDLHVQRDGLSIDVSNVKAATRTGDDVDLQGRFTLRLDRHRPAADELALLPEGVRSFLADWAGDRRLSSDGLLVEPRTDGGVRLEGTLEFHPPSGPPTSGPVGRVVLMPLVVDAPEAGPTTLSGLVRFEDFTPDALGPVTSLQGPVQVEAFELGEEGRGNGRVEGLSLKVAGLALADIRATLFVRERVLVTDDLVATLASGHLSARWRLHLGRPAAHEGRAELLDADMGQLLQALGVEDTRYRGRLNTVVEWATPTGRIDDLVAVGAVRVRDGWLGEMPSVRSWSSLLGSLGSNTPQEPFREGYASFRLAERRLVLPDVRLAGRGLLLPGRGMLTLDGFVDLVFTADVLKNLLLPGSMEVAGLGNTLRRILPESGLYHVRLRGKLGEAEPEVVSVFGGGR